MSAETIFRALVCTRCGRRFVRSMSPRQTYLPRYCTKACRNNAHRVRHDRRKAALIAGLDPCPTPDKRSYDTWEQADRACVDTDANDRALRAYACPCGSIHIGRSKWFADRPSSDPHALKE